MNSQKKDAHDRKLWNHTHMCAQTHKAKLEISCLKKKKAQNSRFQKKEWVLDNPGRKLKTPIMGFYGGR